MSSPHDHALVSALVAHVGTHVGPVAAILHCPGPEIVHVDVLHVAPTRRRPCHTLLTCGMSRRPMCPPPEAPECRYAELFLSLPPSWPIRPVMTQEASVWPVRELSSLARLPHLTENWLWHGHTVGHPDPAEKITLGADFTAWLLGPHLTLGHDACVLRHQGRRIHYLSAIPIYEEELELARRSGSDALFHRLEQAGVNDVIDVKRRRVCWRSRGESPGPRA